MSLPAFDALIAQLRERLKMPLPGEQAQLSMAPATRIEADRLERPANNYREASVMAALFPGQEGPSILLTKRRETLNDHPGQISFPGGRLEPGESAREAALRETHEEIGLAPERIDILGTLSPIYISVSNFWVQPFLGMIPSVPDDLKPQDAEVSQILRVPLDTLLLPETRKEAPWNLRGHDIMVPYFGYQDHTIWGATAMMLAELVALVESL